jgi:hypothetical protein
MLQGSGWPIPFVITPAWRHVLVACDSEALMPCARVLLAWECMLRYPEGYAKEARHQ